MAIKRQPELNPEDSHGSFIAAKKGRPTKYGAWVLPLTQEYLDSCVDTHDVIATSARSGQVVWNVKLPSVAGLALHLGIDRETVGNWAVKHEPFSRMIRTLQTMQEQRLLSQGLAGNYAPMIAKLVLTKHGYTDKQDITSGGEALKPMVVDSTVAQRFTDAPSQPTKDSE